MSSRSGKKKKTHLDGFLTLVKQAHASRTNIPAHFAEHGSAALYKHTHRLNAEFVHCAAQQKTYQARRTS